MNIELKNKYIMILESISKATGLEVCLAGGAIRDLIHSKQAKDLDIEILNHDGLCCIENYSYNIIDKLSSIGADIIGSYTAYEGSSMDAHVEFVLKFKLCGYSCDLILRDTWPESVSNLVALYDMNINQVALYKGAIVDYSDIVDNFVRPTGKFISTDRLGRIMEKYPEYDYTLVLPYVS